MEPPAWCLVEPKAVRLEPLRAPPPADGEQRRPAWSCPQCRALAVERPGAGLQSAGAVR